MRAGHHARETLDHYAYGCSGCAGPAFWHCLVPAGDHFRSLLTNPDPTILYSL